MTTETCRTNLKEEDIRPAELMADKQSSLQWDIDFLISTKSAWVKVPCPACDSDVSKFYGEKNGFQYEECCTCETVFTNPRPSLPILHQFYAQSKNYEYWNRIVFPKTEEARRVNIFRPRAQKVAGIVREALVPSDDRIILEVGAAFGWFCEEIQNLKIFQKIIAVEPTPGLAATCRKKGFLTIQKPIENVELDGPVDVVVSFEVIEHLFSPSDFIRHCNRLLKPKGLLILSCPNLMGFDVGLLGLKSGTFDHEHMNYFHPDSLKTLVERFGFEVISIETPGKLDVDIVGKAIAEGRLDISNDSFLRKLFTLGGEKRLGEFQRFLAENLLSSHLWIVARKR